MYILPTYTNIFIRKGTHVVLLKILLKSILTRLIVTNGTTIFMQTHIYLYLTSKLNFVLI